MTPTAVPRLPIALSLGVLAVSFAAIFIRLTDAPALIIASYRLAIGGAVMRQVSEYRGRFLRRGLKSRCGR